MTKTVSPDSLRFKYSKFVFWRGRRLSLYRQIRTMVKNNSTVNDALESIWEVASDNGAKPLKPLAILCRHWISNLANGSGSFAGAVRDCVPSDEYQILEAGEYGANFDKALGNVIDNVQRKGAVRGAIIGGTLYPAFLFAVLVYMLRLFGTTVIPPLAISYPMEKWTGLGGSLTVLVFVAQYGTFPLIGAFFASIAAYFATLHRWSGRGRAFFDRIPPWSMYRMQIGSAFMLSISALVRADVPITKALEKIRENANPYFASRLTPAILAVSNGDNLGEALAVSGYDFPDKQIVSDLKIYARNDGFSENLESIANEWVELAVSRVKVVSRVMNGVMLILIAGVMAWGILGTFDITNQISAGAIVGV